METSVKPLPACFDMTPSGASMDERELTQLSEKVFQEKYQLPGESMSDVIQRATEITGKAKPEATDDHSG